MAFLKDIYFQLLTLHYERCARYYGSSMTGSSSDEEKRLTMMLFSNIFDSLSKMVGTQDKKRQA